jgi:hypothetical protein
MIKLNVKGCYGIRANINLNLNLLSFNKNVLEKIQF